MSEEKNLLEEAIGLLRMVYMAVSGCDETEPHRAYDQLRLDVLPSIVEWEQRARSVFFKEESEAPQSTRPAPELPDEYHEMKSERIAGDPCHELWFKSTLICYLDVEGNLRTNKIVYAEHLPALAAFLKGAR